MRAKLGRRALRTTVFVSLVVAALGAGAVFYCVHRAGEAGRLSSSQWSRLTRGLARRAPWSRLQAEPAQAAVAASPTAAVPPAATEPAPLAEASDPASAPLERRRPDRPATDPSVSETQWEGYLARREKSVIELQPFRQTARSAIEDGDQRRGEATLVNLNPRINAWYVLTLRWSDGTAAAYHLTNLGPRQIDLDLDPSHPEGIVLADARQRRPCPLWSAEAPLPLEQAAQAQHPYVLLCQDEVALRVGTSGRRTALEWATDFLRDHVWGGEKLTVLVRSTFFQDAFLSTAELTSGEEIDRDRGGPSYPRPALLRAAAEGAALFAPDLGLSLEATAAGEGVEVGQWYRLRGQAGLFASTVQPGLVAEDILASFPGVASPLDEVERGALVYLVAFDLGQLELGFSVGTDHPRVDWSERVPAAARDPRLPGPDGIGDLAPLVATGIIPATAAMRTVATFAGGFKRSHGAFRTGELSTVNSGSHYGFVESGVVLSRLQPGLATVFAQDDGQLRMKTWSTEDDQRLEQVVFARQNGVPLVEPDPDSGEPRPGALVSRWALGNWSGSQDRKFRTVRAGLALMETDAGKRFLLYGYFSSATPSAMARVFQAYGCSYAMLLDMNALEHTYAAVYRVEDGQLLTEHLVRGMEVLDLTVEETVLPRFLGFADNRDYFYVSRRERRADEPLPSTSLAETTMARESPQRDDRQGGSP